jgi:hypothetical protein
LKQLHTSTEEQNTHTITKQRQGAEHNSSTGKKKKANNKVQQFSSTPEDGRLWPKHVRKHVYSYFIRILISFDELCYMRDCVIKRVIVVFYVLMPCGSCKNRRFGGTYRLHQQGEKISAS